MSLFLFINHNVTSRAIIYEVKGNGEYVLAHQNTAYTGRKVGTSPLNLMNVTGGKITIFRPEK